MTNTTVTHQDLARDDIRGERVVRRTPVSRTWAVTGAVAGVTSIASIVASSMISAVYDAKIASDPDKIQAELDTMHGQMIAFHVLAAATAVLLVPFALGLFRRLRATLPSDSIAPGVASAGLLILSGVLVLGSGLDTEFAMGGGTLLGENSAMYNHWIGTIPWLYTTAGLTGLALFVAARQGGVPRWMGRVGLVLGGITVAFGISPLEYMAGMTGPLLLLVAGIGFTVGDRAHRR